MNRLLSFVCALGSLIPLSCAGAMKTAATKTPTPAPASATNYRVVRHFPVGGDGGWDDLTVDSASHRLFISRGDHVVVVDVESGTVLGEIPKTEGVHGIAIAPALHRGFVSAGRTATVTIFDLESLKVLGEVKTTGDRPDAILFDPASERVFTFNAGGRNATAIDAATGTVAGTIPLDGKPEFARADGMGHVYVNIEDTSEIVAIDSKALTVLKRWKLTPCEEPSGLAIDRANRRLFSGCGNQMMAVSNPDTGQVVTTMPIGEGVDGGGFDPSLALAFSSNGGSGTLTIVHEVTPDRFEVVSNVPTQKGARTMALDEQTHRIYLVTAKFGPPPAPTADRPHPRPTILPGTFEILEVAP